MRQLKISGNSESETMNNIIMPLAKALKGHGHLAVTFLFPKK